MAILWRSVKKVMRNVFNGISAAAASIVHVLVGTTSISIGRFIRDGFADMSAVELPLLSRFVFRYTGTALPIAMGLMLGVATAAVLVLTMRSERGRDYLPILITVSFVTAFMHLVAVGFGAVLPLLNTLQMAGA